MSGVRVAIFTVAAATAAAGALAGGLALSLRAPTASANYAPRQPAATVSALTKGDRLPIEREPAPDSDTASTATAAPADDLRTTTGVFSARPAFTQKAATPSAFDWQIVAALTPGLPPATAPEVRAVASMAYSADEPTAARPQAPHRSASERLSDAQIAAIKERLQLTPAQEQYWPPVEAALRAVARQMREAHRRSPRGQDAQIDLKSAEVQRLTAAAVPLVMTLREEQKREVRTLARLIGLETVAAQI